MSRTYLVECYWPEVNTAELEAAAGRALRVADDGRFGGGTQLLDSILIPTDEIVLCFFEAPSARAARRAADLAELPCERVVECVRVKTGAETRAKETS